MNLKKGDLVQYYGDYFVSHVLTHNNRIRRWIQPGAYGIVISLISDFEHHRTGTQHGVFFGSCGSNLSMSRNTLRKVSK